MQHENYTAVLNYRARQSKPNHPVPMIALQPPFSRQPYSLGSISIRLQPKNHVPILSFLKGLISPHFCTYTTLLFCSPSLPCELPWTVQKDNATAIVGKSGAFPQITRIFFAAQCRQHYSIQGSTQRGLNKKQRKLWAQLDFTAWES